MTVHSATQPDPVCVCALTAAAGAAVGYLGAWAFTAVAPVTGAIFGATYALVDALAQPLFGCGQPRNCCSVSFIVASVVSALATKAIMDAAFGIALTTEVALILAASSIAASVAVAVAFVGCCCCLFAAAKA